MGVRYIQKWPKEHNIKYLHCGVYRYRNTPGIQIIDKMAVYICRYCSHLPITFLTATIPQLKKICLPVF